MNKLISIGSVIALTSTLTHAKDSLLVQNTVSRSSLADSHAPIGVMGDHVHGKGEWMVSYRYMNMHMEDLHRGSNKIASTMAASGYMMTPLEMDMDMHMVGLMYAPSDKLTLMFMANYIETSMTMANAAGVQAMTMRTSGLGDSSLTAMYQFYKKDTSNAHVGLGVILPTGSTDKLIATAPMPPAIGRDQPFPMQLGSGSFGLKPSITYNSYFSDKWSWGAQANATIYLDENDEGYTLGNRYEATAWIAHNLTNKVSVSARIKADSWDSVDGTQTNGLHALNPIMSSPADPANTGGTKVDLLLGLNYKTSHGSRFALELGQTIHQDLDGVQLGYDWTVTAGYQFAW